MEQRTFEGIPEVALGIINTREIISGFGKFNGKKRIIQLLTLYISTAHIFKYDKSFCDFAIRSTIELLIEADKARGSNSG